MVQNSVQLNGRYIGFINNTHILQKPITAAKTFMIFFFFQKCVQGNIFELLVGSDFSCFAVRIYDEDNIASNVVSVMNAALQPTSYLWLLRRSRQMAYVMRLMSLYTIKPSTELLPMQLYFSLKSFILCNVKFDL